MKFNKTVVSVLLAMLLVFTTSVSAMAASPGIDTSKTASLNVRILKTGDPAKGVPGGKVEIYRLTSVVYDPYSGYLHKVSSNYSAVLDRTDVANIGKMTAAEEKALIARIRSYISENKLSSDALAVPDVLGNASFTDLPLGLYLVVQTEAASQYTAVAPFLITLPQYSADNTTIIYSVDAAPKVGTADPIPTRPPRPTPPPPPYPPWLPQTGQLWWPVYVLAGLGLALFVFGWLRRKEDRSA